MFLLILENTLKAIREKLDLHSNMFLLILQQATALQAANIHLHSNMFLLIQYRERWIFYPWKYLHSNMFLLIRRKTSLSFDLDFIFTFQYVSINTKRRLLTVSGSAPEFTFQYVSINTLASRKSILSGWYLHSNMFLLIHYLSGSSRFWLSKFTFQYVSINTYSSNKSSSASR